MSMQRVTELEKKLVMEVLSTDFKSSEGSKMMSSLESEFATKYDVDYAISFINGTATMHAALEALNIGIGDEVIVPPLTMSATTFAVLQANATPIFADVEKDTYQISYESIKSRLTEKTKAIITVALYGLSPDMDPIVSLAKREGVKVIEDNAQCFLGEYNSKLVGTLGDCASFSFQSSKHLTSGEGGIVITNDESLAERIRKIQSLGYQGVSAKKGKITKKDIQDPEYLRHVSMGWNYRMPELCCAVALAQVKRMDELVEARIKSANLFSQSVREFSDWFIPQKTKPLLKNSYWTWTAHLKRDDISWYELRDAFLDNGGDGVYAAWQLTYLEPMFKDFNLLGREEFISQENIDSYRRGLCPNAEYLQPRIFQFKTNYWEEEAAKRQSEILFKTLKQFD